MSESVFVRVCLPGSFMQASSSIPSGSKQVSKNFQKEAASRKRACVRACALTMKFAWATGCVNGNIVLKHSPKCPIGG